MTSASDARRTAPATCAAATVQATCVALGETGLLLLGPPGSGKSDLALRLIDEGAALVADDLVELVCHDGKLTARLPQSAPPETRGRLEVRGLGILPVRCVAATVLGLAVELKPQAEIERLPEPQHRTYLGVALKAIALDPRAPSAAAKLRLVTGAEPGFIMPPP